MFLSPKLYLFTFQTSKLYSFTFQTPKLYSFTFQATRQQMSTIRPSRTRSPIAPKTKAGILRQPDDDKKTNGRVRFNFDKGDLLIEIERFIEKHKMPLIVSGTSDLLDGIQIIFTVTDIYLSEEALSWTVALQSHTPPHASLIDRLGLRDNEYSITASMDMHKPGAVFGVTLKINGEASGAILTRLALTSPRNLVSVVSIGALVFILSLILLAFGYHPF